MRIPLIDLKAQYREIRGEIDEAIGAVLNSGTFILGPQVETLEREIAAYLGVRFAVGVGSGTDALILMLRAYEVGPGDEVIVPAFTFFATAEVVSLVGATPVFVDIDPQTFCIDTREVEARLTPRTRALIPVHMYGHPADLAPLLGLGQRHGIVVIEDNAQAIGAAYRGRFTGSLGDAACLSFFPSKNLGAYGDGGMVVTNDSAIAQAIRMLRTHGWRVKYYPERLGVNSRLDELQAAVLRVKLRHLDAWTQRRRAIADQYRSLMAGVGAIVPYEAPYARHVYHLYVLRVLRRDAVRQRLAEMGIATGVYYPLPVPRTAPYSIRAAAERFPHAEQASVDTLAVPMYPQMTAEQVEAVAVGVREALVAERAIGPGTGQPVGQDGPGR